MEYKSKKQLRREAVVRLEARRSVIGSTYDVVEAMLGIEILPEINAVRTLVRDLLADDDDDSGHLLRVLRNQLYDALDLDVVWDQEKKAWKLKFIGHDGDGYRGNLVPIKEVSKLEKENAALIDLLRDAARDYRDAHDHAHSNCAGECRDGYMELPVDSDGIPVHIGDAMECRYTYGSPDRFTVCAVSNVRLYANGYDRRSYLSKDCHHYNEPTAEDILREFAGIISPNCEWEDELFEEYAAKLLVKENVDD